MNVLEEKKILQKLMKDPLKYCIAATIGEFPEGKPQKLSAEII